jgi:hypothetical protein
MTATGELLNLPVAMPMRSLVSAYNLPQKRDAARYHPPQSQRVHAFPRRRPPETCRYGADGYTRMTPAKGDIIDIFT